MTMGMTTTKWLDKQWQRKGRGANDMIPAVRLVFVRIVVDLVFFIVTWL